MDYLIKSETLTDIADAIRGKTGESGEIQVSQMAAQISNIPSGGDYHVYSTTEQVVGEWIDGKTLYEKTFEIGSFSSGEYNIDITGLETLFIVGAFYQLSGGSGVANAGYYVSAYDRFQIYFNKSTNKLIVSQASSWSSGSGYIVLRYTKTSS